MSTTKVLVTGATGYIGGSVLTTLLNSSDARIKASSISALVRKQSQADILKEKGIDVVLFSGLDDTEALREIASRHDVVIHTASSSNPGAAAALIQGLADRKKQTGKDTHLIHTGGTSAIGDHPLTGAYIESRVFSDKDDIYAYQQQREDLQPYGQRTTDLTIFEKGEAAGVKTYILMSPTIYGLGSGHFNRLSIQIDVLIRLARRDGVASVVGSGAAEWDHVHISDLVLLYEVILAHVLAGDDIPSNKKGIYFNETGHQSWREVSERIAKEGYALGHLKSSEVIELTLDQAIAKLEGIIPAPVVELAFASRSRTQADLSREVGWRPKKTRQDFEDSFRKEWEIIAKEPQN